MEPEKEFLSPDLEKAKASPPVRQYLRCLTDIISGKPVQVRFLNVEEEVQQALKKEVVLNHS